MSVSLAYGLPGMGKTTWMHDYIRAQPTHRYFVMDRAAEWGMDAPHWRGKAPQLSVYEAREDLPQQWPEAGVFVFRGRAPEEIAQLVLDVGNATYVDDEIDFAARRKGWNDSPLRVIVHQGRHAENAEGDFTQVNIIGACRRPQSLHNDITEVVNQVAIFRVQGSRTLERLRADSMIEDSEWDTIRRLPKFTFLHWPTGEYMEVEPLQASTKEEAA